MGKIGAFMRNGVEVFSKPRTSYYASIIEPTALTSINCEYIIEDI